MSTSTNTNFNEWLKATLVTEKYMKLPEATGISKSRMTRIIKNPDTASVIETVLIGKALGLSVCTLIKRFNFGGASHLVVYDACEFSGI